MTSSTSRHRIYRRGLYTGRSDSDNDDGSHSADNLETPRRPAIDPFGHILSLIADRWTRRKERGDTNSAIVKLMQLEGLEEVKQQFLTFKFKTNMDKDNGRSPSHGRYHAAFQGNPGIGKTTVAGLYGELLGSVLEPKMNWRSCQLVKTSGVELAAGGLSILKSDASSLLNDDTGVHFINEAYQLILAFRGKQVLDFILWRIESRTRSLAVSFAGNKTHLDSFFVHNPGLANWVPWVFQFANFTERGLWNILQTNIQRDYRYLQTEDGIDGVYRNRVPTLHMILHPATPILAP